MTRSARVSNRRGCQRARDRSGTARLCMGRRRSSRLIPWSTARRIVLPAIGFVLTATPPAGPRSTIDVMVDRAVATRSKPFGTDNHALERGFTNFVIVIGKWSCQMVPARQRH